MKWKHLCALAFLIPIPALAGVEIAEIAWMGTADASSNEWIELANAGPEPVSLDGWTLEASDGTPVVALSGTISGAGRYLIERTDDTTVPNISADLVASFGAGLANAGETLYLRNAGGAIVDTVSGGENWEQIGGNNSTKETPQRTSSGWITAAPTPRQAPVSGSQAASSNSQSSSTTPSAPSSQSVASAPSASVSSHSVYPRSGISVSAGSDIRTFIGFPAEFSGSALGLYDESIPQATYRWNFGDGTTGVGEHAEHTYRFAGEYVVTLEVFWGTYRASDRVIAVVTDPEIRIARAEAGPLGFIELMNTSREEIDLSRWTVGEGTSSAFFFPDHSVLPAGRSVLYGNDVTHLSFIAGSVLELRYPNGARAFAYRMPGGNIPSAPVRSAQVAPKAAPSRIPAVPTQQSPQSAPLPSGNTKSIPSGDAKSGKSASPMVVNASAAALWGNSIDELTEGGDSAPSIPAGAQWFFALAGIILIALAGFIIARTKIDQATVADEYAIIEDIIEGKDDLAGKA